jgi:hypothetical protein
LPSASIEFIENLNLAVFKVLSYFWNSSQGDGGGGIYCPRKKKYYGKTKWVLRAIMSYGTVDCNQNRPNVDVYVPEYRDWILDNTWY